MLMLAVGCQCQASVVSDDQCIDCHSRGNVRPGLIRSHFIDPMRFANSVHAKRGISCTSCHEVIAYASNGGKVPHRLNKELKCPTCHQKENHEYAKSRHAQVSEKRCCCCHDPHYSVPFIQMSAQDRKKICLMCHRPGDSHRWLPQKELHFNYLECTSCHDLNAQIGMVFFIVDTKRPSEEVTLDYNKLAPFMEPEKEGLADTLDRDGSGRLSAAEIAAFVEKLHANGIPGASLQAKILVLKSAHNFTDRGERTRDCSLCHSKNATFYSKLFLEIPEKRGDWRRLPVENEILGSRMKGVAIESFYLLGESKVSKEDLADVLAVVKRIGFKWLDLIGCFIIAATMGAAFFHAMLMSLTRTLRKGPHRLEDIETLPMPIWVWHWLHSLGAILLLLTGIQLRLPDVVPIFANFLNAVNLHSMMGIILMGDYVFWLAYHLWQRQFKSRLFVSLPSFVKDTVETLNYYGYLIFTGKEFPSTCRHYVVFDPVERCFYVMTMLVGLPIQIITGLLLMNVQRMMPVIRFLGGIRVVDAVHLICAYLFVSSMIIHLYLHTLRKYRNNLKSSENDV